MVGEIHTISETLLIKMILNGRSINSLFTLFWALDAKSPLNDLK